VRRSEYDGSSKIIDGLRDNARPIDGIDAGKPQAIAKGVVIEH
jgi:hypothetical protein